MSRREYYEALYTDETWVRSRLEAAKRLLARRDAEAIGMDEAGNGSYWDRSRLVSRVRRYQTMLDRIKRGR